MNYKVKINDRTFEVVIEDLHARPIVAVVDGEAIEVWPLSEGRQRAARRESGPAGQTPASGAPYIAPGSARAAVPSPQANGGARVTRAPIPGVITAILVQPGDQVAVGQELCVLEAMKMKNSIRASVSGKIKSLKVSVGQHVKHHDVLIEFED